MLRLVQQLQPSLPLSTSFTAWDGALRADYPARWQEIRAEVRAQETRCAVCGGRDDLHVAHLDAQPDRLHRENLAVLCSSCHEQWDKPHVSAASALTCWMRGGSDLSGAAWDAIAHVRRYGPGRLTPAMVDVVVADILLESPRQPGELIDILTDVFPFADRHATTRAMGASLARLRMRGLHIPCRGWISLG